VGSPRFALTRAGSLQVADELLAYVEAVTLSPTELLAYLEARTFTLEELEYERDMRRYHTQRGHRGVQRRG
jgi:hypothetical protein